MTRWILVPVRNGLNLTQKAVKTFLRQDLLEIRVLLMDNASMDGTNEWARSMHPKVVTIRREPPLSVAASWNRGLTLLFEGTTNESVLVVNNDVELRSDTYRRLVEDGDGFVTAVSVGDRKQIHNDPPRGKRPHPDFSCFLIHREVWDKVGKFDENFIEAYAEDADYHIRMQKAGVIAHCIDVPFYHAGHSTLDLLPPEEAAALRLQADANRAYFKQKWGVEIASPEYYEMFKAPPDDH